MGTNEKRRRVLIKQAILLVIFILVVVVGVSYYISQSELSHLSRMYFTHLDGSRTEELYLEIADTAPKREQGLMWRKELGENKGMLFVYPYETDQAFWMKNTYVSLDIIFLDKALNVVGVLEHLPKLSEQSRSINKPSQYAIEANASSVKKWGLNTGSKAVFLTPLPLAR